MIGSKIKGGLDLPDFEIMNNALKDVRANCFCASLLRTQIHLPCHLSSARAKF